MSDSAGIIVGVLLLLINAFFVGAEFAVISARRSQIEPKAKAGSRAAKITMHALENVSEMLACAQLGITMASLGLGAVAEPALAHLLEKPFHLLGVPDEFLHPVGFALALSTVVYLHVLVGEMVPKNVALAVPERAALILAPPLVVVSWLFKPLVFSLNTIANLSLRIFGVDPKDEVESAFTAEQMANIVDESHREGLLDADPAELLAGALEFTDRVAADLMVSQDDLVTVSTVVTPDEVEQLVAKTGFSRFIVVDDQKSPTGYLHLKDVLYADGDERIHPVPAKRVRSLGSVYCDDEAEIALQYMQSTGSHLARVANEQGQTLGVLFLEDVIEELVGEIEDSTRRV